MTPRYPKARCEVRTSAQPGVRERFAVRLRGALLLLCLIVSTSASGDLRIGSWNITHLGWNNEKDIHSVAGVVSAFDLVAIQEVMDPDAVEALMVALEQRTGEPWSALTSSAFGRSSYREHYAYVWRRSAVSLSERVGAYADPDDDFARDPYAAAFRSKGTGEEVLVSTVHIIYGETVSERAAEITTLDDYWRSLESRFAGTPIILTGDFNLEPDHRAWDELAQEAAPLIVEGATTLSTDHGEYAHLYDNLWIDAGVLNVGMSGILRVSDCLDLDHGYVRERVSDHSPVYLTLGEARVTCPGGEGANPTPDCVDINQAAADALTGIIHVGPARAEAIIEGRPWSSVASLRRVPGLSRERVEEIASQGLACVD